MQLRNVFLPMLLAGLFLAAPVLAQTVAPQKQKTDGDGPTMVGPASGAFKQKTDGDGLPMVGPASGAFKQKTQSLSHANPTSGGLTKQE